ncbi:hypothetical protein F5J12DRAFT_782311 [Pisolithus orientalis]|uniref:uncharacterized protein n=1 Tax=Pisolithus orientalis TaxID=936130 RepID=UPI00222488A3|nr:uncharacterized protein F5J12DRAFT_782311 [Pisolithus orientalis]KAI6008903.1 hypothetical protein F5J12DRAFT_782311 [Pisolithus orientalis]
MAAQFMLWTSSLLQNLRAPSSMNHRYNYSASFNQGGLSEDSLVSLYDDNRKRWNWELRPPPGSDSPPEQPGPLASELPVELEKLYFEKQVALFLNAIGTATKSTMPSLSSKPQHQCMADWSRTSLQGSTGYSQKPDLILVDNTPVSLDEITWLSPKVIAEYSKESFKPASCLGKMMDTKAYLTLKSSYTFNQEDPSFLGRGTVCYLACYNGEYYIIKDYWVEEFRAEDSPALKTLTEFPSCNTTGSLRSSWALLIKLNDIMMRSGELCMKSRRTHVRLAMKLCARPMSNSRLSGGVSSIEIGEYDLGGTEAITKSGKTNVPSIWKSTSLTHVFIDHPTTIHHTFVDDIKSLFYVFIWISILYDGPLGHEHQDISHVKTLLGLWSEKVAKDLEITRCTKFTFLNDLSESRLDSEVLQYFQDLIPLANEWCILLGQSLLSRTAVQFSDVISLFDHFLASMSYKKPPEMTNAFQQIITQHKVLNSSMCPSQENDMDVMSLAIMSSKHLCEEAAHLSILKSLSVLPQQDSVIVEGQGWVQVEGLSNWSGLVLPLKAKLHGHKKKGWGPQCWPECKTEVQCRPTTLHASIANGPSPADMPLNPVPQSSTAVATPVFHQCPTNSHHFGFSVLAQQPGHIVPPRMEPDLQVLNNPYIATIWGDQVPSNTSHLPTPQPNYQSWFIPHQLPATVPDSCINPSLDSLLSLRQTSATTDVRHKSSEKLSSEGSSEEESESLSNNPSDTEVGKVSSNEFDKDEDDAFGWGAMNLRQSTHPGFSQETMTSNPIHHNSLPPDHKFQYSCDEDDNVALQSLQSKDKAQPEGSQCGTVIDVLPCARLGQQKALVTVVVEWNQHSVQFEDGYWPDHKQDMACLLLGDISTWHLELKSVMLATMPSVFNLVPPSDVAPQISVLSPSTIQFPFPVWLLSQPCIINGTEKMMPQFSGKAYNSIFHGMMKVLNDILCNPYHGTRLHNQLSQWEKEGWAALQEVDLNVERYQHIQAVLD